MDSIDPIQILKTHFKIVTDLYNISPSNSDKRRKLQKLIQMKHGVIPTPELLYEKHIIREFNESNAVNLSSPRLRNPTFQPDREPKVNTVIEDPQKFYVYSDLNLIISKEPVRIYKVKQAKNRPPTVHFLGKQWAIFTCKPTYHFVCIYPA